MEKVENYYNALETHSEEAAPSLSATLQKLYVSFDSFGDPFYQYVPRTALARAVLRARLRTATPKKAETEYDLSVRKMSSLLESQVDDLPRLDDEEEATFEDLVQLQQKSETANNTRAVELARKMKEEQSTISRKSVTSLAQGGMREKRILMRQFKVLEHHFLELCSSNEQLVDLYCRIDLNSNGLLGYSEISTFLISTYPLLAQSPALRRAFEVTAENDPAGGKGVRPVHFKALIANIFYFSKIYLAFDLVDADKDHRISEVEWEEHNAKKVFRRILNIDKADMDFKTIGKMLLNNQFTSLHSRTPSVYSH